MTNKVTDIMSPYLKTGSVDGLSPNPYQLETMLRTNSTYYSTQARLEQFKISDKLVVKALRYTTIIDSRRTFFCAQHHGEILAIDDPRVDQMTPPNHWNCRSTWTPIFETDNYTLNFGDKGFSNEQARIAYNTPAKDFGGVGSGYVPKSVIEQEKT